ncbi:YitT family protein [Virgibacillus siamensis]|uniref:YitT family protein n=1 Tax=Virgibacillus siamensis TaxID=480071 RepID=UPI000984217C|nr:YitT family protein [Virgibacillus siamensis]
MIKKMISTLFGSCLIAIGINCFVIPNHLVDGGIIGLGLIAKYSFGFKPGLTIIVLSLPLYIIAWFRFRTYFYNGMHGLLISSFLIDYFHPLSTLHTAPVLISALTGGLFIGTGIGIMLLAEISTGGTDLLALMVAKVTSLNVGMIILFIDGVVILLGSTVIKETTIFYSSLMVAVIGLTTSIITKNSS